MWGVGLEPELGNLTCPLDQFLEARNGERCTTLRDEHEGRRLALALQPAQGSQLAAAQRMDARGAILPPADM
jgi:hypothetical protein